MKEKLSALAISITELRKKNPQLAEPKDALFADVVGYSPGSIVESPLYAAHNLWAALHYAFVSSSFWEMQQNYPSVSTCLFESARALLPPNGDIVTDETTANLAKICQEFFSNADQLDFSTKRILHLALGDDPVHIFNLLSTLFDMANYRYTLKKLEDQIVGSVTLLDQSSLGRLCQQASALLPPDGYMAHVFKLDTTCCNSYDELKPFARKFLNERARLESSIENITFLLVDNLSGAIYLRPPLLPEQPQQGIPHAEQPIAPTVLPDSQTDPSTQLETLKTELDTLRSKQALLVLEKDQLAVLLEEKPVNVVQQERERITKRLLELSQLKETIEQNKLNLSSHIDDLIPKLLETDEATLETYLRQQQEKTSWRSWSWGTAQRSWQWATGTTPTSVISYEKQKEEFIQTLEQQIKTKTEEQTCLTTEITQHQTNKEKLDRLINDLDRLTATIKEKETSQALLEEKLKLNNVIQTRLANNTVPVVGTTSQSEKEKIPTPLEQKRVALDTAEKYLDSLLNANPTVPKDIPLAVAKYFVALLAYVIEAGLINHFIDLLKSFKAEIKSTVSHLPTPQSFFKLGVTPPSAGSTEPNNVNRIT